jgi:UDP-glucose:glycoprotein glucosyltransferase
VYDEYPSSYFPFLHLLSSHLPSLANSTDSSTLSTALGLIETHHLLPDPSAVSTLHYALGLHTAVPKIEAYYSWYETSVDEALLGVEACGSWVEWKGKGFCDVNGLRNDIESAIEDGGSHPCVVFS